MNEFQREIYKTIDVLTDDKLKDLGFDKTKRGRVVSVSATSCVVEIDGEEYTCKLRRGIYVESDDIVFVRFPQNDSVDKYVDTILGGNQTPEHLVVSAEEILQKLKTVDGHGSGLDADMLDGKHGSEYAKLEDLEGMDIDISGETIVKNINDSTSIIDDKNLSISANDAINKRHIHNNKAELDKITQSSMSKWDEVTSKADKTEVETLLGNKVDKIIGMGLSESDFTALEKAKLLAIEHGANKYIHPTGTNPHNTTKADIGLSNVDNLKQATKDEFNVHDSDKAKHIAETERANWNDSNNKKHTHSNKSTIDGIDQSDINLWNTTFNKVDKVEGKGLSTEDYTTTEKSKLSGIEAGANKYMHPSTHPASMITGLPAKLPADGGDSATVGGFTVLADVPANAKFTDTNTTYGEITTAEIDAGTSSTLRTVTGRRIKYLLDIVQGWINGLTKSDIGLGNVDNAKQATKVEFDTHNTDGTKHITGVERTNWNAKSNLALGTTSATAYRGDLGNTAYAHSQSTHARTDATNTVNNATNGSITVNGVAQVVYTHPSSHPASFIIESATKRFVSDSEKSIWNGKANVSQIPTKVGQLENDKSYVTQADLGSAGYGDMTKGVYDKNNNGIVDNAEKVNGFTVGVSVPSNAKFTDTIYTHPSTHPASMITGLPTSLPTYHVSKTDTSDKNLLWINTSL